MKNELIAFSGAMRQAVGAALDVARTPTTVLLTGETGVGKEAMARVIHESSPRAQLPFTLFNCGAIAQELGKLQEALAHGGTVVLDEISAIPMEAQARVLALLEGDHASRLIATTHRDLRELVERGQLRSDLYYRLDVFPIVVPPLRERRDDLVSLATMLLTRIAQNLHRPPLTLSPDAISTLETQRWPGNVRELGNVLERAVIRARSTTIEAADLGLVVRAPQGSTFPAWLPLDLVELERLAIGEALRRTNGNRTHAARLLNLGLRTLRQKLNGPSTGSGEPAEASVSP